MTATAKLRPLADAFAAVAGWLDGGKAAPPRTRADVIAERFGLDAFGRNLLLLGAWAALDPVAGDRIAALHGDPGRTVPSLGLALVKLPGANWSALGADAPLRGFGLIRIDSREGLGATPFSLAEALLLALVDAPSLTEELALQARRVDPPATLSPSRQRLADAVALRIVGEPDMTLQLCGADPLGKEQAAAAALKAAKRPLYAIGAAVLPGAPADIARLAQLWRRDLMLTGGALFVDADRLSDPAPLALFASLLRQPLIVGAPDALALGQAPTVRLDMPRLTAQEQVPLWRDRLGPYAKKLNGTIERLAGHFPVSPELAESVAAELAVLAPNPAAKPKKGAPKIEDIAWDAARRFARPRMEDLARRIDSEAKWNDLVLPPAQKDVLKAIIAQVRNRPTVYESWGFAKRSAGRGLGISVLFSGPSGAGKTLAGEILGAELGLDVYRIDLSSMMSKWIGETEKNLRRLFDAAEEGAAILQFDEADALFGKRGEINESRDRHANIEVSYLLQRIEEYRGLSILTTNFRSNIDSAFLRRLRFIIDFDFPGQTERAEIWQRIFPQSTPRAALDFDRLSQLNLSGGSIRNVAMGAAFAAADRGHDVGMAHILSAARLEYEKSGRSLTSAELKGWLL
ncbi:ATP-binding protein [Sphingopyxis sp. OPL5]|uniref:ATP-binding protein n=1 Tax=Sphingopyxis sp. OPL5 TaxID=2486273 RepID=UPI00164EA60E|nr:ATP-binding protein [Sphingopyxis sp. OPL5]QNO27577.1 ATP-binding protein [Sphingopyxis sp. OPL5]